MAISLTDYLDEQLILVDKQVGGGSVAGPLNGAKLALATDNFVPGKGTSTTSFTTPTTVSFTPPVLTWGAAVRAPDGDVRTDTGPVLIQMSDGASYNIYGYAVLKGDGSTVLFSETFADPVELVDALSYFYLTIPFAPNAPETKSATVSY